VANIIIGDLPTRHFCWIWDLHWNHQPLISHYFETQYLKDQKIKRTNSSPGLQLGTYIVLRQNLQSRTKVAGTVELHRICPIPPNQCRVYFNKKGKKWPDYQHCKWGEAKNLLRVPIFLSGIVWKKNLKNVTPLAVTKVGGKGRCTVSRVQLTSAAKKKQHVTTYFTWVGIKERKVIFLNDLLQ